MQLNLIHCYCLLVVSVYLVLFNHIVTLQTVTKFRLSPAFSSVRYLSLNLTLNGSTS